MPEQKDWTKIDNAGKIFPSTSTRVNTGVFRFYCEMEKDIDPLRLQEALNETLVSFPHLLSVMRSGLFWFYLEKTELRPVVHTENTLLCSPLFNPNKRTLLFDVSYYNRRINFEIFHALMDGTAAIDFITEMITRYVILSNKLPDTSLAAFHNAAVYDKSKDSFFKYYKKHSAKPEKKEKRKTAYHLTGQKSDVYSAIEGILSASEMHSLAKKYNTTITVFLTSLLVLTIMEDMLSYKIKKPIVITVPVNLRNFFPSETARNFFGSIRVAYNVSENEEENTLENIVACIDAEFKRALSKENLSRKINEYVSAEKNIFAKIVPLSIKNFFLKIIRDISDMEETMVISNIGRVAFPEDVASSIKAMGVFASTKKTQLCVCSIGDTLSLSFTSRFYETDLQRHFFKKLSLMGLSIEIRSNIFSQDEVI